MVNSQKLKAIIVERNMTQQQVAASIGIAPYTLTRKLRRGVFNTDEIEMLVKLLDIDDPIAVFFPKWLPDRKPGSGIMGQFFPNEST